VLREKLFRIPAARGTEAEKFEKLPFRGILPPFPLGHERGEAKCLFQLLSLLGREFFGSCAVSSARKDLKKGPRRARAPLPRRKRFGGRQEDVLCGAFCLCDLSGLIAVWRTGMRKIEPLHFVRHAADRIRSSLKYHFYLRGASTKVSRRRIENKKDEELSVV
jgi:hypothetical protein